MRHIWTKEDYQYFKEHDYCPRCGKQQSLMRMTVCWDCAEEMAEGKRQALAAGKCINCWKNPALTGRQYCDDCRVRRQEKQRQRYHERKKAGVCVYCGKAPQWHGRTTCAYCWGTRKGFD
jgi:hypothetical protein